MNPDDLITKHFRLKPIQQKALEKLGLKTLGDLLYYLPHGYNEPAPEKKIATLEVGETATIYGLVLESKIGKAFRRKIPMAEATIEDETGRIKAVWFHQAYLAKRAPAGRPVKLSGRVSLRRGVKYLANPAIEEVGETALDRHSLFGEKSVENENEKTETPGAVPRYPEKRGLSSLWFHHHVKKLLLEGLAEKMIDPLPTEIIGKYHLPRLAAALVWIHLPEKPNDAAAARKRFSFEEIFFIQLKRQIARANYQAGGAPVIKSSPEEIADFLQRLPFELTAAQDQAIKTILSDLAKPRPMMRLLEGDVGSGKTAVAAATAYAVVQAGGRVAYLAPTEVLARQHFESFINYFKHLPIQIGLITGSECRKFPSKVEPSGHTHVSRAQLLRWVAEGSMPIIIGTHALIAGGRRAVKFFAKNSTGGGLSYAIIDEQHRFGVEQRAKLVRGGQTRPHLLSMTATPIPRTLALTIYGDLDLTLLDELPPGRKEIITKIIDEAGRQEGYQKIKEEITAGRQAIIICPRINAPDPTKELALEAKSAKEEAARLQKEIFPDYAIGLLHSKLKPKIKEEVMADFAQGVTQILVATSVVEVGVNVPNATIIIIEGAERFGLAQLHQLRGRVFRSHHQAYCYLISDTKTGKAVKRLQALEQAKSGFALAELDLKLRGAGALAGEKQWGLSDIGMEALQNLKMVEAARTEAVALLAADRNLTRHPLIKARLARGATKEIHFE